MKPRCIPVATDANIPPAYIGLPNGYAQSCSLYRSLQEEISQSLEHRALSPMQHRGFHLFPAEVAVIEVPVTVLHVLNCPVGDLFGQRERIRVYIGKKCQCVDRLRRALNVDWQRLIVIVLRSAVRLDEVSLEILEAALKIRLKLAVTTAADVAFEAIEIVSGMKIVDPMIL
jgi:hypothetical protein